MDARFFRENRQALGELMEEDSIAIFFSGKAPRKSADLFYDFEVDRNFFYLSGLRQEDLVLVLSKKGSKLTELLYLPPVDDYYEKWYGILLRPEEAIHLSGLEQILPRTQFLPEINRLIGSSGEAAKVYLYSDYVDWEEPENAYRQFARQVKGLHPYARIFNAQPMMTELRSMKSDPEIKEITQAIGITKAAFTSALSAMQPGKFEYEIRSEIDYQIMKAGSCPSFPTICASGRNATILHYASQRDRIEDGSLVLMDFGACSENYCADITRTIPANGKFTDRQKTLYSIVLEAQALAINQMKPGVSMVTVNDAVKAHYATALRAIGLIQEAAEVDQYYYHNIGHPLGLDPHDLRNQDKILRTQQVYTVEPGLYLREEGIGIRIEDDVLITKEGAVLLSKDIIREISDLENAR